MLRARLLSGKAASPTAHALLLVTRGSCAAQRFKLALKLFEYLVMLPGAKPFFNNPLRHALSSRAVIAPTSLLASVGGRWFSTRLASPLPPPRSSRSAAYAVSASATV